MYRYFILTVALVLDPAAVQLLPAATSARPSTYVRGAVNACSERNEEVACRKERQGRGRTQTSSSWSRRNVNYMLIAPVGDRGAVGRNWSVIVGLFQM
jgi:hypothetical protein